MPAPAGPARASPTAASSSTSSQGETRTPEFLAKNPNGRIPALELEDGTVLAESDAILFYLAEGTPFLPDGSAAAGRRSLQWLFFEQYSHEPFIAVARYIHHLLPPDTPRRAELPRLEQGGYAALGVMERRLARPSVPRRRPLHDRRHRPLRLHPRRRGGRVRAVDYPAVAAWLERVARQPGHIPITAG